MLETAEGQSALVKILIAFRRVQAEAAHIIVHPPKFALAVSMIVKTLVGGNKVQCVPGVFHPFAQVIRHRTDVCHQPDGIAEYIFIDLL